MRHDWFLQGLAEGTFAASLGFPVGVIFGCDPSICFLSGLVLAFLPPLLLGPFANDFAGDDGAGYHPNLAARILNPHEHVRCLAAVLGLFTMLSIPIGILSGLQGRALAFAILGCGALLCVVMSALLAWLMGRNKPSSK